MRKQLIFALLLLTALASCKFKPSDNFNWDADLVSPIAKSSLTIGDAIQDTSLIRENGDNSLTLVFRDTIVDIKLIDIVTVPDTSVEAQVTLDSIALSTDSLSQDITLADIARQLKAQGNPLGDTLLARHGQTMFFLPGVSGISSGDVDVDASQFFTEADIQSGNLEVEIINQLPVDISNVTYHLRNNGNYSDTLIRRTITSIPKGTSVTDVASLAGKTVESQLAGQLEDLSTEPEFNVPIDTNDYIRLKIKVKNLKASRATAVFPAQTVINDNFPVKYYFGDGIELTRMAIGSGGINVTTVSTINDTLEFIYRLPSTRKDGLPVSIISKLDPAPIGGQVQNVKNFDLAGYEVDLTLNADSVNLFPQNLIGNLVYSGNLVTMDLNDSIYVFYGLLNIIPSYVQGYLGTQSFDFKDSLGIDFFNNVLGGTLDLTNPKAELTFINSVGMDGELRVNNFTAYNSRSGNSVSLNSPFVSSRTHIPGPKLPNVGQSVETKIKLDKNNSNIRDFISLLPDQLDFDLEVVANENADPTLHDNFATDESRITALLDMEIPLDGVADRLHLQDTVDLNLTSSSIPEGVEEGTIKLALENTFPLAAEVQMYFRNAAGMTIDSLFLNGPETMSPGIIDPATGIVQTPGEITIGSFFDKARLENLTDRAARAIISVKLSTSPSNTPVKIYSNYGIDFKLIGEFQYRVGL